ncbi:tail fiber assembly protein [Shigella sonnei]|nr:tail fiber assembly protein [Escherichia coli]EFW2283658.1 tail fiber assembly protein [Shigella sonnei]EGF2698465.1 tail fiber assembly protein [Shigella sonnei]
MRRWNYIIFFIINLTLTSLLAAWKKYRVLLMSCWHFLSAVIEWPAVPVG